MIELKLSQGAKPAHGGILPASKNTPEIAEIRLVTPGTTVHSPTRHAEFDSPEGLVQFLQLLRELSEGKPVGFKICIGDKQEFIDICQAITTTGIIPDFISIDGAEVEQVRHRWSLPTTWGCLCMMPWHLPSRRWIRITSASISKFSQQVRSSQALIF